MNIDNYNERIRSVGNTLIQKYIETNRVITGINGPYDDQETEVRNLAHLIIIAAVEYLKFGREEYKTVVSNMGEKLLTLKQTSGIYKMRSKPGKDECNGTIGHAWLIEGLLYAYKVTGDSQYLDESESLFNKHEYNYKIGLWGRPLMGATDDAIDFTFNHELWYAATLAEFLQYRDNNKLKKELNCFFNRLPELIKINNSGRIAHSIYTRSYLNGKIKYAIARLRDVIMEISKRPNMKYKEDGYHLFNLMALSRIYKLYPETAFFNSRRFLKTISYISSTSFTNTLLSPDFRSDCNSYGGTLTGNEKKINIYGYPYNVPGFEAMYCSVALNRQINEDTAQKLLQKQIDLTWDDTEKKFGKNCHDKVTINYRVYEFYRYLEIV